MCHCWQVSRKQHFAYQMSNVSDGNVMYSFGEKKVLSHLRDFYILQNKETTQESFQDSFSEIPTVREMKLLLETGISKGNIQRPYSLQWFPILNSSFQLFIFLWFEKTVFVLSLVSII